MSNPQNVQQPMFAPVSQNNKFDGDIDLSDIFAEYLNDSADPLATFSAYGNFQLQQTTSEPLAPTNMSGIVLPTGGIRTAFHTANLTQINKAGYFSSSQNDYHFDHSTLENITTRSTNHPIQTQCLQTTVLPKSLEENFHTHKKPRLGTENVDRDNSTQIHSNHHYPSQPSHQHQPQQQASVPTNLSSTGSGITGRLGYSVQGGQLMMPRPPSTQSASITTTTATTTFAPSPSAVQLPIGVGIRVGGSVTVGGGIHPTQSAQNIGIPTQSGSLPLWTGDDAGGLTDQAVAERRQRNREHAKRSRVRKKFLLESLQAEVSELQAENERLRMLVQSKIPLHAHQIISECCAKNPLFDDSQQNTGAAQKGGQNCVELAKSDYTLIKSLTSGQQNFVLSDPRLPDNPIVYASEGFYKLTGYTRDQVLGRNCRFLQGPDTDPKAVDVIRTAVANGTDATTCLLNYKADGTPFWNQFFIAALRDSDNCIVNYVGVQCAIDPEAGASALEDKVNSVLPLVNKDCYNK